MCACSCICICLLVCVCSYLCVCGHTLRVCLARQSRSDSQPFQVYSGVPTIMHVCVCACVCANWHIKESQHHSITAYHSITASQHHSITASQHHSITASQHHSITASNISTREWDGKGIHSMHHTIHRHSIDALLAQCRYYIVLDRLTAPSMWPCATTLSRSRLTQAP